jgi:Prp8 binding protein
VASGSADRFVYIWDTNTRQIQYRLPGHEGSVTSVDLHPEEPISKLISHKNKIV